MYTRHILCKKEQAMHKEFHKSVLNRLKFFPLISKEHPSVVDNFRGQAIKEERKSLLI